MIQIDVVIDSNVGQCDDKVRYQLCIDGTRVTNQCWTIFGTTFSSGHELKKRTLSDRYPEM